MDDLTNCEIFSYLPETGSAVGKQHSVALGTQNGDVQQGIGSWWSNSFIVVCCANKTHVGL